jgi:phosphoserine phosphatase
LDWVRHHQSAAQARREKAAILPGYLLTKVGLADEYRWKQKLMIDSLGWLHDVTPERLEQASEWAVEHNLWRKRRADVIARLSEHAGRGAQVIVASSVFEPIAAAFARRFGAQAIGTPLKIENGRARLAAGLVASERKIQEVLSRLNVERVDYAYGDTALDIPLLEHAEHPVAVYPDKRLHAEAQRRGWQVMSST